MATPTDASGLRFKKHLAMSLPDSRSGWIRYFLSRRALAFPTQGRFIPALSGLLVIQSYWLVSFPRRQYKQQFVPITDRAMVYLTLSLRLISRGGMWEAVRILGWISRVAVNALKVFFDQQRRATIIVGVK